MFRPSPPGRRRRSLDVLRQPRNRRETPDFVGEPRVPRGPLQSLLWHSAISRGGWTDRCRNLSRRLRIPAERHSIPHVATDAKAAHLWHPDRQGCGQERRGWRRNLAPTSTAASGSSSIWDREPQKTCPIRVAQVWAGKQWGGQFIPRIGMEVVVEFLEGDPDRPLVTGCVFNGDNKYPLRPFQTTRPNPA